MSKTILQIPIESSTVKVLGENIEDDFDDNLCLTTQVRTLAKFEDDIMLSKLNRFLIRRKLKKEKFNLLIEARDIAAKIKEVNRKLEIINKKEQEEKLS